MSSLSTTSIRLNAGSADETSYETPKRVRNLDSVELRRVQQQVQRTNFDLRLPERGSHVGDNRLAGRAAEIIRSLGKGFEPSDTKSQDVEVLHNGVVQVMCNAPASVVLKAEQFLGDAPEIAQGLVLIRDIVPVYQDVVRKDVGSVA